MKRPPPLVPAASIEAEADRLTREAFAVPRTPRSGAYREGVRAGIEAALRRERGEPRPAPEDFYTPGSAEFDAYAAGIDEGRLIVKRRAPGAVEP